MGVKSALSAKDGTSHQWNANWTNYIWLGGGVGSCASVKVLTILLRRGFLHYEQTSVQQCRADDVEPSSQHILVNCISNDMSNGGDWRTQDLYKAMWPPLKPIFILHLHLLQAPTSTIATNSIFKNEYLAIPYCICLLTSPRYSWYLQSISAATVILKARRTSLKLSSIWSRKLTRSYARPGLTVSNACRVYYSEIQFTPVQTL